MGKLKVQSPLFPKFIDLPFFDGLLNHRVTIKLLCIISFLDSIVFHENKKVNLVLEVEDTLCAMTLEIDTELKKEAFCFFNDICQWSILYIL